VLDQNERETSVQIRITENHNLLYFNIPISIIQKLGLTENDYLEYDVRGKHFFIRKKGSTTHPSFNDTTLFKGLQVERSITRNNTILRTNLPKEVSQPLAIRKGDFLELSLDREVIIGTKKE